MMLEELRLALKTAPAYVMIRIRALQCLLAVLSFQFFVQKSIGADIARHTTGNAQVDTIVIDGIITLEDQANFTTAATASNSAVVVLNSQEGATLSAVEMGKTIRLKGFATAVPENALCASACALMWLAGSPRFIGEGAHIGFHASYIDRNGTLAESGAANALVGAYLNQLGLSQKAIAFGPATGNGVGCKQGPIDWCRCRLDGSEEQAPKPALTWDGCCE